MELKFYMRVQEEGTRVQEEFVLDLTNITYLLNNFNKPFRRVRDFIYHDSSIRFPLIIILTLKLIKRKFILPLNETITLIVDDLVVLNLMRYH